MFSMPQLAAAQQVVAENEIRVLERDKDRFSIKDFVRTKDGYQLFVTFERWGRVSRPEGQKDALSGRDRFFPALVVYTLDENLNVISKQVENFNVNDLEELERSTPYTLLGSIQQKVGDHTTDKPVDELRNAWPEAFFDYQTTERYTEILPSPAFRAHQMLVSDERLNYSGWCNCMTGGVDESVIGPELPFDGEETSFFEPTVNHPAEGLITVMGGPGRKKDKLATYKEPVVVTYDHTGQLVHQENLVFTFPRYPIYASPVASSRPATVFVLGQAPRIGKKNNDPDKTNYNMLAMNPAGEMLFRYPFKYGNDKKELDPQYAFGVGDDIWLFVKGRGRDSDYGLLRFAKDGLVYDQSYDIPSLREKTSGNYMNGLQGLGIAGFEPHGHYFLDNGEMVIYGESRRTVASASYAPDGSVVPAQHAWNGFVFLHINSDGQLINQYVLDKEPLTGIEKPLYLRAFMGSNGKIWFEGTQSGPIHRRYRNERIPAPAAAKPVSKSVLVALDLNAKNVTYFNAEMEKATLLNCTEYNNIFPDEESGTFILAGFGTEHLNGSRLKLVRIKSR